MHRITWLWVRRGTTKLEAQNTLGDRAVECVIKSSVRLGPPHNLRASLLRRSTLAHTWTSLNSCSSDVWPPEFAKRKLSSPATQDRPDVPQKSMGSWLQTLGRWIKPFSFGFSFQIYLLLRTINSRYCFLLFPMSSGPLGIPIKLDDFRVDVSQETVALNVLPNDIYIHIQIWRQCVLGLEHCN